MARPPCPPRSLPGRALVLALGVLWALPGCQGAPEVAVDTPYGRARAGSLEQAEELARLLSVHGPRVRALLPDTRAVDPEVWLEDFSRDSELAARPEVVGLAAPGSARIRIREGPLSVDAGFVLVHELVHALMGESWAPLPALVKEGLCDTVACRLVPGAAAGVAGIRLFDAASHHPGLALELSWFSPDDPARARVTIPVTSSGDGVPWDELGRAGPGVSLHDQRQPYGAGWLVTERIVERIGFDGLHGLCRAATAQGLPVVPVSWIQEAAGLSAGGDGWRQLVLMRIGPDELAAQCAVLSPELAVWLTTSLRGRYPGDDVRAFLDQALPTLGWEGGEARVALATVPALRAALSAVWDAPDPESGHPGDWWLPKPGSDGP